MSTATRTKTGTIYTHMMAQAWSIPTFTRTSRLRTRTLTRRMRTITMCIKASKGVLTRCFIVIARLRYRVRSRFARMDAQTNRPVGKASVAERLLQIPYQIGLGFQPC